MGGEKTPEKRTWYCNEQADISHVLNGFETNFSRIPTSQSVISPLAEPAVEKREG